MKNEYTAAIKKVDDWWVGWIEELPLCNKVVLSVDELLMALL